MKIQENFRTCPRCGKFSFSKKNYCGEVNHVGQIINGCGLVNYITKGLNTEIVVRSSLKIGMYYLNIDNNRTEIYDNKFGEPICVLPFRLSLKIQEQDLDKYLSLI